ncbi:MAG: phage tail tube protein [Gammaproteobacteria bacterium]|nr:phage tail tube protein [Gammaproteobacteria bacterium]
MRSTETYRHNLGLSKGIIESAELAADRQVKDYRHGNKSITGDINVEMSFGSHDDFLEAVLEGTWTTPINLAVTANVAVGTFTRAAGSWITDGMAAGQIVTVGGYVDAGNNGRFVVTAVTALVLTVTPIEGQTMIAETGDGETFKVHSNVRTGTTRRSFTLERDFDDITQYLRFTGTNFSTFAVNITQDATGQIVSAVFGTLGKGQTTATAALTGATYGAETTTSPFDSYSGIIRDGGTNIAVVTTLSLNVDNGMSPLYVVGSDETLEPSQQRSRLTGSMTVLFENTIVLDKFINETETTLQFSLVDLAGNQYMFYIPRVKYNSGQPDVTNEDPVTLSVDFVGLLDPVTGNNIVLERVPA